TPLIMLLVSLILVLTGCGQNPSASQDRYVILSPEVAEIIHAIEGADNIVGVTEECTYPTALRSVTRVGKFGLIDREKVISLNPSIIFTTGLEQGAITDDLRRMGFRVEVFYPQSIADLITGIRDIGRIIGKDKEGNAVADELSAEIAQIKSRNQDLSRPQVYLEIYRHPLMSVSDASFVGQLIETAGGDNIFATLERDYARIKAEDVIKAAPDLMICYSHDPLSAVLSRMGWQNVPAIRHQRIYYEADIDPDLIQRAGPRIVAGMRQLERLFDDWRQKTGAKP
ncbi:MAG: ABC transporter substrate-binding protein, partial [Candidatus Cloacimonetes bacterium]|nr:ABC transporter substrate-binding protein [Candidatus Cloacimonadota bacterium]